MYLRLLFLLWLNACSHQVAGNEGGSTPSSEAEATEYRAAILRCYKQGGTRIVKIMGELRCYN